MPEFVGSYTVVKTGHKTKVKSDVKPFIKNAKVAPWYYAIQYLGDDGKPACMLMTEAGFKSGKIVGEYPNDYTDNLGKIVKKGFKCTIELYDEETDHVRGYEFYANEISCAIVRATKHSNLCTKIEEPKRGFFFNLFSRH